MKGPEVKSRVDCRRDGRSGERNLTDGAGGDDLHPRLGYDESEQDLTVDFQCVPALPGDRLVLGNVQLA